MRRFTFDELDAMPTLDDVNGWELKVSTFSPNSSESAPPDATGEKVWFLTDEVEGGDGTTAYVKVEELDINVGLGRWSTSDEYRVQKGEN